MRRCLSLVLIAAFVPHAAARQPQADPADPAVAVAAVRYESAFTGYRGFREEPVGSWRGANDEVARAGGHVGILKGASGAGAVGAGGHDATQRPATPVHGAKPPSGGAGGAGHAR